MKTKVIIAKAFSQDRTQGSPAGIVLDSTYTEEQMQQIATKVGYSATAFITRKNENVFNIRFFTTIAESPICVHAALAASKTIIEKYSLISVKISCKAGDFSAKKLDDSSVVMQMSNQEIFNFAVDKSELALILNIPKNQISELIPKISSAGKPKLIINITTLKALLSINPDVEKMREYCHKSGAQGFFIYSEETKDPQYDFHARHFNPLTLAEEDPICGVGSAALAAYLLAQGKIKEKNKFSVEMGFSTGTSGVVVVDVTNGVKVGGHTVVFDTKEIEI